MAFDPNENIITVGEEEDFLADSGKFFITMLKKNSSDPGLKAGAGDRLRRDWTIIETWLGCAGRELNQNDFDKIGKAWKAYIAIGLAPAFKLQESFDQFSEKYKQEGYSFKEDKAPTEVMDVFDRLMASDEEIELKRQSDIEKDKAKLKEAFEKNGILKNVSSKKRTSIVSREASLNIDKDKLPIAIAVIWLALSIPLSIPIYEEFFYDDDLLNRVFSWALVGAGSWVPVGWKWLTNKRPYPKPFVIVTVLIGLVTIIMFMDDRHLDDHVYVPIGAMIALILTIYAYDGSSFFKKRNKPFSKKAMAEAGKKSQAIIEKNAERTVDLADEVMQDTADFIGALLRETMGKDSFSALESIGISSELPKFQRDKVAAEFSLVCALHVFGKPYDDFRKSGVHDFICSHFVTKEAPIEADPEQFGYITRNDLPKLLKLVDSMNEAKHPNVQAAFVFAALMKINGFPNPIEGDKQNMRVPKFGIRCLNKLRGIYKA
jgi:hypothetical protein